MNVTYLRRIGWCWLCKLSWDHDRTISNFVSFLLLFLVLRPLMLSVPRRVNLLSKLDRCWVLMRLFGIRGASFYESSERMGKEPREYSPALSL